MKENLQLVSWKVSLGLATPAMLVDVATQALVEGSDSKNLAILAGEDPSSKSLYVEDLVERFHKGMKEESIPIPTKSNAELSLLVYTLQQIKNRSIDPVEGMYFIDNELDQFVLFPDAEKYVGAKLGLEHCYTWYREYQDYSDGSDIWYYTDLPRDEAALKFKEHIVEEASKALVRIKPMESNQTR